MALEPAGTLIPNQTIDMLNSREAETPGFRLF
jgi:hypothetical protein